MYRSAGRWTAGALGAAAGAYAAYAATAWSRYGHPQAPSPEEADDLLDRYMPRYDIVERHHIRVNAPADITFAAAREADLMQSPIVRAVFKAREIILGSQPDTATHPRGIVEQTTAIGWGVLAEVPGREIVVGAATQPWKADVVFRPVPEGEFLAFDEPDHAKIVWTLRADPAGSEASVFRTETRAVATDGAARAKFRRYWSLVSPGIILIRWMTLGPVKREAERRAASAGRDTPPANRGRDRQSPWLGGG